MSERVAEIFDQLPKEAQGWLSERDESGILSRLSELRDHHRPSFDHSLNVADVCRRLGIYLELPPDRLKDIFLDGLCHDLGKIAVPTDILDGSSKFSDLTQTEVDEIRSHIEQHPAAVLRGRWSFVRDYLYQAGTALHHHTLIGGYGDERQSDLPVERERRTVQVPGLENDHVRIAIVLTTMVDVAVAMEEPRNYNQETADREVIAVELEKVRRAVVETGLTGPEELGMYDRAISFLSTNFGQLIEARLE